ncbi:MAG: hypothetical protein J0H94_10080 [Rhizobiales bacterium]|nr:hypothetical protein [Hyphomicrobiales bacterium]
MADPAPRTDGLFGRLAGLAEQVEFEVHYDAVATSLADRFTLQTHYNIAEMQDAYAVWIAKCASAGGERDYRHFIRVIGLLIESLARHRIVTYTPMIRPAGPMDPYVEVLLKFPDEATALVAGAALYVVAVERLTARDPSVALSPLILENAAGILRRRPDAAIRFRELLQLATPWS